MEPLPKTSTDDVMKFVKKALKTHKKTINGEVMDMYAESVVGDTLSRKLLMLLHCAKV